MWVPDIGFIAGNTERRWSYCCAAAIKPLRRQTSNAPRRIGRTGNGGNHEAGKKCYFPPRKRGGRTASRPRPCGRVSESRHGIARRPGKSGCRAAGLLALRTVAEAYGGLGAVAAEAGISRESLYRALSPKGNPTLKTLLAVLKTVGMRLSVEPENHVHA